VPVFSSLDPHSFGLIPQSDFMRIIRLAIDTHGMSDSEFLQMFAPLDRIRDRRGYVRYHDFFNKVLHSK
jgi:Ca2+-binding EF-hand superfamily protein